MRTALLGVLLLVASSVACFLLSGCGDSSGSQAAAPVEVNPFPTAESLVEHINRISVDVATIDPMAFLSLIQAENAVQERLVRLANYFALSRHFEQTLWEKFGQGVSSQRPPLEPDKHRAVMTTNDGSRANATQLQNDGRTATLYLVRLGERWWISGFTLEYSDEAKTFMEGMDEFERAATALADVLPGVTARVLAGEFASAVDAHRTLILAAAEEANRRTGNANQGR